MSITINIDGAIGDEKTVMVSALDRGFLYGDSVYEVVRTYQGRLFAVAEHLERLSRSAEKIGIALPPGSELARMMTDTVAHSGNTESWCRLIVTRGVGPLTLDPTTATTPSVIVIVKPFEPFPESTFSKGVRVAIPHVLRTSAADVDPAIKSGNYLNSIMALREARLAGFDDALMLNQSGHVTEATTSNVFIVRDGKVYTPSLDVGLLPGVTRAHLINLLRDKGYSVTEASISVEELYASDEVMLTSTVREVQPVIQVEDRMISGGVPGPLAAEFRALFHDFAAVSVRQISN